MRSVALPAGLALGIGLAAGIALAADLRKPPAPVASGVMHENQNVSTERQARTTEFFIVAKGKPRTTPAS